MALLDEHGRASGTTPLCDQAADERTGGAAGRGILPDADRWVEKPGVRDRGRIDGIEAVTSVYLQGIDNAEIIEIVHARRAPMVPVSASLRL